MTRLLDTKDLSSWAMSYLLGAIEGHLREKPELARYEWNRSVLLARQYDDVRKGHAIRCPICDMVSYNPNDIREGYCGNCKDYTTETGAMRTR